MGVWNSIKGALPGVLGGAAAFIPGVGPIAAPLVAAGTNALLGDEISGVAQTPGRPRPGSLMGSRGDQYGFQNMDPTGGVDWSAIQQMASGQGKGKAPPVVAPPVANAGDAISAQTRTSQTPGFWGGLGSADKVNLGLGLAGTGLSAWGAYKAGKERDRERERRERFLSNTAGARAGLMGSLISQFSG